MRKVRHYSNSPALMFAAGLESIISEKINRPVHIEHDRIQEKQRVANRQDPRGNLVTLLMRQFANC